MAVCMTRSMIRNDRLSRHRRRMSVCAAASKRGPGRQRKAADRDSLTTTLLQAPASMTLVGNTLTWTPTASDVGHHSVQIQISDNRGGVATQQFTMLVPSGLANNPPLILGTPGRFATVDEPFQYTIVAADPEGSPVTLSLDPSLPAGVVLSGRQLTWTPDASQAGVNRITVLATDSQGAVGRQSFDVRVLGVNTPPTFVTDPVAAISAGQTYFYAARAIDTEDTLTYSIAAPTGVTIGDTSGVVSWPATLTASGDYPVTITATDARGLSTDQSYTLSVSPDAEAPRVSILLSSRSINVGQSIDVQVVASDNVAVASTALFVDGVPVTLDANGRVTLTPIAAGIPRLTATATDTTGNVGSTGEAFFVVDPADVTPPTVAIESPISGATIEYLADVIGTATDDALASWSLEASLIHANQWRTIASASVIESGAPVDVASGLLGVFDPTLLKNNQYQLRLTASDIAGNTSTTSVLVGLDGQAKIGVNVQPIVDLTIPVAGGPAIEISRTHSQLTADEAGDFGNGWSFCSVQPDLRETPARTPFENLLGQFAAVSFREGDKVYITAPDCQRVGFTFSPTPHTGIWTEISDSYFDPRWIPDPGVDWRLYGENDFTTITSLTTGAFDVDGLPLPLLRGPDNTFFIAAVNASYNPLGYELVNKQGVRYSYDQEAGLESVIDRNGNTLQYGDDGITSSSGQQVQFQRDAQGRITAVIDPDGNQIDYTYDAAGNLVDVAYPNGLGNSYRYNADNYLEAINPDDLPDQETISSGFEYDLAGRLSAFITVTNDQTSFTYDLSDNSQRTFDAFGFSTTTEFDNRGNVVRNVDREGFETFSRYDAQDNLVSDTDARGNQNLFDYDERRNLTKTTDRYGTSTSFTYDEWANITSIDHPLDGYREFQHDDAGNLTKYIDSDSSFVSFTVDDSGRTTEITDKLGRITTQVYGDTDQPIEIVHTDGTKLRMNFDQRGNMTTMIDEEGIHTILNRDARGRLLGTVDGLGRSDQILYDGWKMVGQIDNLGNRTDFVVDAAGRWIVLENADGTQRRRTYDPRGNVSSETDENGNTTVYEYSPEQRLASTTDALGFSTTMEYDGNGNRVLITDALGLDTAFVYDAEDRLVQSVDPLGQATQLIRDAAGRVARSVDALGFETQYEFNLLGQITQTTFADGGVETYGYDLADNHTETTDALGFVTTMHYDDRDRLIETTDPRGAVFKRILDDTGRVIESVDPLGRRFKTAFDEDYRVVITEDSDGNQWRRAYDDSERKITATDPLDRVTTTFHDEMGRVIQTVDALGNTTSFGYAPNGQLVRTVDPRGNVTRTIYDPLNRVSKSIDALGNETSYGYDAVGNLISMTDPSGAVTAYSYDDAGWRTGVLLANGATTTTVFDAIGRVTLQSDSLGRETIMSYDAMDRLVSTIDPRGSVTQFTYDLNGRRIRSEDPNGNTHQYQYDKTGNLVSATDPFLNSASWSYDLVGNLTSTTDRIGRQKEFGYDVLDRMVTEEWFGADNQPRYSASFTYDALGNLLTAEDSFSQYQMSYDALNRMSSIDNLGTPSAPRVAFAYQYNASGNRSSVTDSLGTSLVSEYDSRNLLQRESWSNSGADLALVDFDYDSRGYLSSIGRRNSSIDLIPSITTEYQHNSTGAVSSIAHLDSLDQALVEFSYTRDLADQITEWTHHGQTRKYTHDDAGQLTSGAGGVQAPSQFQYDASGNRNDAALTVGLANRLIQDADFDYIYDDEGNLSSKTNRQTGQVHRYEYDFENRITGVEIAESDAAISYRAEYVYDVFDRRIAVEVDADGDGPGSPDTHRTVYLGQEAWADFDENGDVATRYLTGDGMDDHLARWTPDDGTQWYLSDHLGSVHDIVDDTGVLVLSVQYDDFGAVSASTGAIDDFNDRFLYTGREYDGETGLYYYRARHYDPSSGRFTAEDSLGYGSGDSNFYRYVGNAPLHANDPSGHVTILEKIVVVGAQTAAAYAGGYMLGVVHGRLDAWGLGQRANPECHCGAEPIDWNRIDQTGHTYAKFSAVIAAAFGTASQSGITSMVSRGAASKAILGAVGITTVLSLSRVVEAYSMRDVYPDLYKARLMSLGLDIGVSLVGAGIMRNPGRSQAQRLDDFLAADARYIANKRELAALSATEARLGTLVAAERARAAALRESVDTFEGAAHADLGLKLKTIETARDAGVFSRTHSDLISSIPGRVLGRYDALNPGPLGRTQNLAGTFSGGRYAAIELADSVVMYLASHPGGAKEFGAFWSFERPLGSLQSMIDSALLPSWGNGATCWTAVRVPAGSRINVGQVSNQGGAWVGGGSQVLVEGGVQSGWKIGGGSLK